MAGFSGAHGLVAWTSKTSLPRNSHNWTCDIEHSALDITPFSPADDAGVFTPLGVYKWSGSFDVYLDVDEEIVVAEIYGAATTLTLTATGGHTLAGCAIAETVSVTTPSDGVVTATVNFRGTGKLTIAATNTTAEPCTPAP